MSGLHHRRHYRSPPSPQRTGITLENLLEGRSGSDIEREYESWVEAQALSGSAAPHAAAAGGAAELEDGPQRAAENAYIRHCVRRGAVEALFYALLRKRARLAADFPAALAGFDEQWGRWMTAAATGDGLGVGAAGGGGGAAAAAAEALADASDAAAANAAASRAAELAAVFETSGAGGASSASDDEDAAGDGIGRASGVSGGALAEELEEVAAIEAAAAAQAAGGASPATQRRGRPHQWPPAGRGASSAGATDAATAGEGDDGFDIDSRNLEVAANVAHAGAAGHARSGSKGAAAPAAEAPIIGSSTKA